VCKNLTKVDGYVQKTGIVKKGTWIEIGELAEMV
jgi:hypothetical protein